MLGYGTKVGLAPLHAWLPDAHAEGPTPISAVLSGLLLNVALYAVLRFKLLLDAQSGARSRRVRCMAIARPRLAACSPPSCCTGAATSNGCSRYSSIEHMGIIVFAFGIGGPLANFAGLLHMIDAQPDEIGDLLHRRPYRAGQGHAADRRHPRPDRQRTLARLGLVVGVFAIAGLPPLGMFMSEFLVVSSTFARAPWLAVPLVAGLLVAFGALLLRLHGMAFGEPSGERSARRRPPRLPIAAHLGLVLIAGIYLPPPLVAWFQHVAGLLR